MKMETPSEEERFLTNVLDLTALVHDLSTICWNAGVKDINPQMVLFGENYLKTMDKTKLIEVFIQSEEKALEENNSLWEKIKERDEKFFIENAHTIFQNLPIDTNKINAFKIFFTSKNNKGEFIIGVDDRDAIFNIFESLVKICIKYVHRIRGIKMVQTAQGLRPAYLNKKFPRIKVKELANLWKIELPMSD